MYVCICICMYMYMYVYVCVCMYMYVYVCMRIRGNTPWTDMLCMRRVCVSRPVPIRVHAIAGRDRNVSLMGVSGFPVNV